MYVRYMYFSFLSIRVIYTIRYHIIPSSSALSQETHINRELIASVTFMCLQAWPFHVVYRKHNHSLKAVVSSITMTPQAVSTIKIN